MYFIQNCPLLCPDVYVCRPGFIQVHLLGQSEPQGVQQMKYLATENTCSRKAGVVLNEPISGAATVTFT